MGRPSLIKLVLVKTIWRTCNPARLTRLGASALTAAMAGPSLGVNVQAAMRGQGIGKGASESRDAEDPPELRIFADPDFATMDIAGA